ncbi:MAG: type II secretion system protein [Desulfobacterales bacterium]|nr:type II secretion system protein [Desulfobacterales bacterium]
MKQKNHTLPDQGFTLIELMVVLAVLSITLGWLVHAQVSSHQLAESEIGLQRAVRALQNQVEILRILPYEELKSGTSIPFDARVIRRLCQNFISALLRTRIMRFFRVSERRCFHF